MENSREKRVLSCWHQQMKEGVLLPSILPKGICRQPLISPFTVPSLTSLLVKDCVI
jgi:hypothetical protein